MSTPILPFAVWLSGTNQNSIPANDNSLRNQILNGLVISDAVTAQPGSPADGDIYILAATHTGSQWAAFSPDDLVIYQSGTWYAFAPVEGVVVNFDGFQEQFVGSGGWQVIAGGGGASVAGSDKQVQYNDGGVLGAEAGFEYDKTTNTLSVPKINESKGSDIASATTTDIGAATGNFVHITGTTTITGFGTVAAGARRLVVFDGALTLTHNATSLILPTGANITTAAGDTAVCISEGSGNWRVTSYQRKDGTPLAGSGGSTQGKQMIGIVAAAIRPSVSGGCAALAAIASAANQPDIITLDFDPTTEEYAQFAIPMPKKWNEGTLTIRFRWSHAATTTNFGVVWGVQAVAVSDDDTIAVNFGTAQTVTDTGGTTNDLYITAETSAMTVAGTPADGDTVFFRVYRKAADASDTMAIDARLHGVDVFVTTNADTDA